MRLKIGVFDSGVGGLSVTQAIQRALPQHDVCYVDDHANIPYGTKSIDQIHGFVVPILHSLIDSGCQIIVIACNTVTTNLIELLRQELAVPLIGMEPMVKLAAKLSESKTITVCATPRTLTSARYAWLKRTYAPDCIILEPDCSNWSELIEDKRMNEVIIRQKIEPALQAGADVIVLGCTHYHWIETEIRAMAIGQAIVLQPEQPVIAELRRQITRLY